MKFLKLLDRFFDPIFLFLLLICFAELGKYHWLLDLFSNFYLHYLFLALGFILFYLVLFFLLPFKKNSLILKIIFLSFDKNFNFKKRILIFSVFFFGLFIKLFLDYLVIQPVDNKVSSVGSSVGNGYSYQNTSTANLKVITYNIYGRNKSIGIALEFLKQKHPDLLFIQEFTYDIKRAFAAFSKTYPYKIEFPRGDFFGAAIYSKYPLSNIKIHEFADIKLPVIEAKVLFNNELISLLNFHPPSPTFHRAKSIAVDQLEWFNNYLSNNSQKLIAAGDFNSTIWSYPFNKILKNSHINLAAAENWWTPTWTSKYWGILIDHVFYKGLKINSYKVNEAFGSDHFLIEVGFEVI